MKKTIAIILTLILTACLLPTVASAEVQEYSLTGDTGYETAYTKDADGNLLWTVKLSDIGTEVRIGSLQFEVSWDKTKLELKGYTANKLTFIDGSGTPDLVSATCNTLDEDEVTQNYLSFDKACTFSYALGTGFGAYLTAEQNNVVATIKFKVKDGVAAGTQLDLDIKEFKLGLVTKTEQTIDAATYTLKTNDGYILAGSAPVDKAALQALYNADLAAMTGVVASSTPKDLADGTKYLTAAQKTANEAALAAAELVLDNASATQAQIDAAYTALNKDFVQPSTVTVSTTNLVSAITMAETFMASADFKDEEKVSKELAAKWEAALAEAKTVRDNAQHTQNQVDAATTKLLALSKTGESTTVFAFAGIGLMALVGLALVVRRRFN